MNISTSSFSKLLTIALTVSILLVSSSISTYAQTNTTDSIENTTTSSVPQTSTLSDSPVVKAIDAGIAAINSGDDSEAKKQLYQAELALEDNPGAVNSEKHIEASLKALKEGDTTGAVTHAEEAKKGLS
ncbi:hypothetical protein [Candidatus Nitrosocosmicus sp. T]